jgi:hypothetical protein
MDDSELDALLARALEPDPMPADLTARLLMRLKADSIPLAGPSSFLGASWPRLSLWLLPIFLAGTCVGLTVLARWIGVPFVPVLTALGSALDAALWALAPLVARMIVPVALLSVVADMGLIGLLMRRPPDGPGRARS